MKNKSILFSFAFIVLGLFVRFTFTAYRAVAYLSVFIGVVILIYKLLEKSKGLKKVFSVLLAIFLIIYAVTEAFIIGDSVKTPENGADYIIVLGAGVNRTTPSLSLRNRIDAAFKYMTENENTVCIASGAQGGGEAISEAQCIKNSLMEKGIPESRIILEDRATSTEENIKFSLEIIGFSEYAAPKIAVASSEYHICRAKLMLKNEGYDPIGVPGKTTYPVLMINYFLREVPAIWYYLLTSLFK